MNLNRRSFLGAAAFGAVAVSSRQTFAADHKQRKFTLDLRAGSVGIGGDLRKQIDLAASNRSTETPIFWLAFQTPRAKSLSSR
jgi:hypothetical protein